METGFRSYHPFVIFLYYVCVGILAMFFNHPLFLLTALILLIFVNLTHDRAKELKKWIPLLLIMSSFIIILNPFFVSRGSTILFYFRGKQVTLEAAMYGVVFATSIAIIIIMFISFNLILNGNKFLFVFSRVFPRIAFLTMLSIRFVPLFRERLEEINAVQYVRGYAMNVGTIRERVRSGMLRLQILLTWSLEESIQMSDSMKSRGYGLGKRSSYLRYKMEKRDWIWLFVLTVLFILCLIGGSLGYGKILIYPELGTLHLYPLDWFVYACMFFIYSFPLFAEGGELARWKLSQ